MNSTNQVPNAPINDGVQVGHKTNIEREEAKGIAAYKGKDIQQEIPNPETQNPEPDDMA